MYYVLSNTINYNTINNSALEYVNNYEDWVSIYTVIIAIYSSKW